MRTNLADVTAPSTAARTIPVVESPGFGERWAAWQAKGAAHDRGGRRRMAFAAPILLLVAAGVLYAFFQG